MQGNAALPFDQNGPPLCHFLRDGKAHNTWNWADMEERLLFSPYWHHVLSASLQGTLRGNEMRKLFIALVLGVTALTFYSALWFKSESIEDDITARVTDDLMSTGAENIDIKVDGRHVTLSGVVYDEATETGYLETADTTYGALGPIDGLTFLADGGYISAIKTADGIALRGTVPNEDVRAALVAQADAATDGAVDDQLVVSGPAAAWQDEAAFGVGQLAGLSSGTLTAAAGAYALSGRTDSDPQSVTADLAEREGWSAFISSPIEERGLAAEVDRLTTEVGVRDARVGDLEGVVSDLQGEIGTRTSERDAIGVELADLRASLTEDQANAEEMRAQLDAATTMIGEKDQTIADLTGQVSDGTAQIAKLETELENRQAALGSTDERVIALTGDLDTANATIADLTEQVSGRDVNIASLTGAVADRDATIGSLNDQVAGLSANADQSVAGLTQELSERDGKISELTAAISGRDASIDGLNSQLTDAEGRLTAATGKIADQESTIATLNAQVTDLDGSVTSTAAQIAALTAAAQSSGGDVEALEGQVADLTEVVAERDQAIAALQARPVSTGSSAEQCAAQATGALEGSRINFRTASAQISSGSVELLERLTGIALACVSDGLSVEIGGHTDAQGADDSNQALSEARAQAVLAFMVERGVPAEGLRAVGFGESQPIASNDTSEGRAQNRRISFDWQAR